MTDPTVWWDTETFSPVELRTRGLYRYAEDVEVMLLAYAIDDEPAVVWDRTETRDWPQDLEAAITLGEGPVVAHHAMFDRTVMRCDKSLAIDLPVTRWRCNMVRALAHSLPGGLEALCTVLRVPLDQAKMKDGKQLVHLFCKPRPKTSKIRRATRETHPTEWAMFKEYARLDVEAMRACAKKMPDWNYRDGELALWHLDQRVNDRGICVDVILAQAAQRAVQRAQGRLAARTLSITNGHVDSATRRDAMLGYLLLAHGVDLPDMRADTLERRMLDPELPAEIRELLAVRLQSCSTSTSKYATLERATNTDGRLRGTIQFDGAGRTGRAAGRLFQPQNLPRPDMEQEDIDLAIEAMKSDSEDLLFDDVMRPAVNAIRGCIVAPSERKLVVSDLANIEGRGTAWVAGEEWKLDAFRAIDLGAGEDLYKLAYAHAFNIEVADVSKPQRQVGKVMELMLGYEGGVGAFMTGAATYGIDLEQLAEAALPNLPADVLDEARGFLAWRYDEMAAETDAEKSRVRMGLTEDAFLACDSLKRLWRRQHPAIAASWSEVKSAWWHAARTPGHDFKFRSLVFRRDGAWLRVRLPSGRSLCYPGPHAEEDGSLSYLGMHQYSKRWQRIGTYGGKLIENIVQAIARDVLYQAMPACEAAGYELVLPVHDEAVTETPDTSAYTAEGLSQILATPPAWAPDMPLAAKGHEMYRYHKPD